MKKISTTIILLSYLISINISCSSSSNHKEGSKTEPPTSISVPEQIKVNFFIENSGSMKGYIVGSTNYINVISDLANNPALIQQNSERNFYLTSGISSPIKIHNLSNQLVPTNFNAARSDLNNLFKTALDSTGTNTVSVLISDGIYDMCPDPRPINTLEILSHELLAIFISKLKFSDFQTLLIKCKSDFTGQYFPGNCSKAYPLYGQERPYYIWLFGDSKILKAYFSDEYLSELKGYLNSASFFKFKDLSNHYKPSAHRLIGRFRQSKNKPNVLEKVKVDNNNIFQFSIAVDFSDLPLSDDYLSDINNYSCSNGFEIVSIDTPTSTAKLGLKEQTHLIVLRKTGNPLGVLKLSLLNKEYSWITSTNIENDSNITANRDQTFGFEALNRGIIKAYKFLADTMICEFSVTLKK